MCASGVFNLERSEDCFLKLHGHPQKISFSGSVGMCSESMYLCLIVSHLRTDVKLVPLIKERMRELGNASSFDLSESAARQM